MYPPAYVLLLGVGFFLLPFTRAFTIDVGFPLKLYEPVFLAALFTFLLSKQRLEIWFTRKLLLPLLGILGVTTITLLLLIVGGTQTDLSFRGGPILDSASRVVYLFLNISIFVMAYRSAEAYAKLLTNFWLYGMLISALFAVYFSFSMTFLGEAPLLPGIERHQLWTFGGVAVSRSGTFEEGNFAGLYFVLSVVLAFWARKLIHLAFGLLGLLLSVSTSGYIAILAVWLAYLMITKRRLSTIPYVFLVGIIAFAAFTYFDAAGKFGSENSSGSTRINEVMTALAIFRDNILFGAGLGQYGFKYYDYEWRSAGDALSYGRHIANSVYAEVLSETGALGFLFLFVFMKNWLKFSFSLKGKSRVFVAAGIGMLVCWIAYPTFNIAFIWAFLGLCTGIAGANPHFRSSLRSGLPMRRARPVPVTGLAREVILKGRGS